MKNFPLILSNTQGRHEPTVLATVPWLDLPPRRRPFRPPWGPLGHGAGARRPSPPRASRPARELTRARSGGKAWADCTDCMESLGSNEFKRMWQQYFAWFANSDQVQSIQQTEGVIAVWNPHFATCNSNMFFMPMGDAWTSNHLLVASCLASSTVCAWQSPMLTSGP